MIPIYLSDGRLYQNMPLETFVQHASHFHLVRNRRGHLKRAILKANITFDARPFSNLGIAFEQSLSTGQVWALGGVYGSAA